MFKKIVHYVTSRRLESHRIKTQCMIEEYERATARSRQRIQQQYDDCNARLQSQRAQREASFKELAQFLSEHLEATGEYVPLLLRLQEALFVCLQQWTRMKLAEERMALQTEKIKLVVAHRGLLDEARTELLRLSQQSGRAAWQAMVAARPPRVSTLEIHQQIDRLDKEVESDARAYQHELRRIDSQVKLLKRQREQLRIAGELLRKEELQPARDAYRLGKQSIHDLYHECAQSWVELEVVFEGYFKHEPTESSLANQWLAAMQDGGSYDELRQALRDTKTDWEAAKLTVSDLGERYAQAVARVKNTHTMQVFATLAYDKQQRNELGLAVKQAIGQREQIRVARQMLHDRCEEIRSFLDWIRPFHPSSIVEQFHQRMEQDGSDFYRLAIGLRVNAPRPAKQRI